MLVGAAVGVAIALGHVPYFAGAARTLADTALNLVSSGGTRLVRGVASSGASERVVWGVEAAVAVLAPGVTALLLILGARGTLRLRAVAALLIAILGVASFFYHPAGIAAGTVVLALAVAAIAVLASGPLVAAPLAALAGLIGTAFVERLIRNRGVAREAVETMHRAINGHPGDPVALRIGMILLALVPLAFALRYLVKK